MLKTWVTAHEFSGTKGRKFRIHRKCETLIHELWMEKAKFARDFGLNGHIQDAAGLSKVFINAHVSKD